MQHRDLVAEHGAEAIDGLWRQRNLGHEDDRRLPAPVDDLAQQLDVDRCLAAPRDAVEEEHLAGRRGRQCPDRRALRGRRGVIRRGRPAATRERVALDHLIRDAHEPAIHERADHGGRAAEVRGEVIGRTASADGGEIVDDLPLAGGAGEKLIAREQRGLGLSQHHDPMRLPARDRRRRARQERRERGAKRHAKRDGIVVRDPPAERQHRTVQRGLGIRHIDDGLGDAARRRRRTGRDADPDLAPVPEGNHHARAGNERMAGPGVHPIGERVEERQRKRDLDVLPHDRRGAHAGATDA